MEPVAVYRRTIQASLTRIWENVLDWEHLPWLHSSSFLGVEVLQREAEGWRAWVALPPAQMARRSLVEVRLHRRELCYWTRTVEGAGAGTEIRTTLAPRSEQATDIAVEFFVPGVPSENAPQVGDAYSRLYAQLWDEDEAMMTRRQRLLDDRARREARDIAPLNLGPAAALRQRLPLLIGAVRVVEIEGELRAYNAVCPHLGGPLERGEMRDGIVTCPWHGYRYDVRTGRSADGRGLCLAPTGRVEVDAEGIASLVW